MTTRVWKPLLVLVVSAAVSAACSRGAESAADAESAGVVVGVVEAATATLRDVVAVPGQAVPATSFDWTVYAPEPALIAEMPKLVGDPVQAGDLLVRFEIGSVTQNVTLRQMAVSEAAAKADVARAEVNRLTPLYEQGIIARHAIETARAELATAEAALRTAEAYLEEARVLQDATRTTARFSGIVAEVWHTQGEVVSGRSDDPILRVVDPTRLEIQIELPVSQALRVRESHPADVLTLAAGAFTALVTRRPVGMTIEEARVPVRLTAPEVAALAMNDIVHVELVLDERLEVIVVPVEAVQRDGSSTFVMTAGQDGIARRRPVRAGLTSGGRTEIVEGLGLGELVIVQGLTDVADGTPVVIFRR